MKGSMRERLRSPGRADWLDDPQLQRAACRCSTPMARRRALPAVRCATRCSASRSPTSTSPPPTCPTRPFAAPRRPASRPCRPASSTARSRSSPAAGRSRSRRCAPTSKPMAAAPRWPSAATGRRTPSGATSPSTRSMPRPTAPSSTWSAAWPTSRAARCASSATRKRASARTICASCASSASSPGTAAGRPDAEGLKACARLKDGLDRLSAERVWSELKKLLAAPDPSRALLWMRQAGVLTRGAAGKREMGHRRHPRAGPGRGRSRLGRRPAAQAGRRSCRPMRPA